MKSIEKKLLAMSAQERLDYMRVLLPTLREKDRKRFVQLYLNYSFYQEL